MQFRLWWRDGPASERTLAAVTAVVAFALLAWAVVPDRGIAGGGAVASGGPVSGGGAASAGNVGGGAGSVGAGAEPGAAPAASASAGDGSSGAAGPSAPAAGAPAGGGSAAAASTDGGAAAAPTGASECGPSAPQMGITDKEIFIGVVIYTLGEANSLLGIPPAEDTIKMYNAVFDHYNKQGGVDCRKLVAKFYEDYVLSAESGRSSCLKMQQDKVFAVLNNLFRPENRNCVPQAKIPNFWATSADTSVVHQFAPYILSFQADYDRLFRDYVFGAKAKGFFDGMKKLGILDQTCFPARGKALRANLAEAGIGSDKISTYNFGCPAQLPTPDQTTAAAVQFRRDGVTHVMTAYREAPNEFAKAADQQSYRPKYAFMDDQASSLASNANPPYQASLDGALFIEKSQEGAEYTPGATFTQATADCAAITKAAGLPGPTSTGTLEGSLHALACIHTKMFVAAAKATKPLTRAGLAAGLATVGDIDLSFPAGPSSFKNPNFPIGAQFWRASVYKADCTCVKLLDAQWRPEFAK